MGALVIDTHTAVWFLASSPRLSPRAKGEIDEAIAASDPVWVPAICLVELAYLVEKGKLPESAWQSLLELLERPTSGFRAVPFTLDMARALRRIPYAAVPDMPDRMLGATALALNVPLVTSDPRLQAVLPATLW